MRPKNIVIIEHESLSYRKKVNYLINELIERNFNVEYWDCSQYFFPGINLGETLSEDYCFYISSLYDLDYNLNRIDIKETIFIVEVFYKWRNRNFFRILKEKGCYLIKIEMYATANVASLTLWEKLKQISFKQIFNLSKDKITNYIFNKYCKLSGLEYDVFISSGTYKNVDYHINHPDWELYKRIKDIDTTYSQKYAVFLDEYFPLHPDLKYNCNFYNDCESKYRESLNNYFQLLEIKYGFEVIVAAHPKSDYKDDAFYGRKIIKNDTVSLVKDSQMVIMHSSAALSFAIMFDKPIVLISTNDYISSSQLKRHQQSVAKFLNKEVVNIDNSISMDRNLLDCIDSNIRDNYIYSYLTTKETQSKNNIDIFVEIFNFYKRS